MARKGNLKKGKIIGSDDRPFRPRKYDKFILIICEDENTEPYYFAKIKEDFPNETVYLKEVGTGLKPKGIVNTAIEERKKLAIEIKKDVDEVWIVFDKDDEGNNAKTLASFNEAWDLAEKENISIAFSNEVFELWLLLHLCDVPHNTPLPRVQIYNELEECIKKNDSFEDFIYHHGKSNVIDIIFEIGKSQYFLS